MFNSMSSWTCGHVISLFTKSDHFSTWVVDCWPWVSFNKDFTWKKKNLDWQHGGWICRLWSFDFEWMSDTLQRTNLQLLNQSISSHKTSKLYVHNLHIYHSHFNLDTEPQFLMLKIMASHLKMSGQNDNFAGQRFVSLHSWWFCWGAPVWASGKPQEKPLYPLLIPLTGFRGILAPAHVPWATKPPATQDKDFLDKSCWPVMSATSKLEIMKQILYILKPQ